MTIAELHDKLESIIENGTSPYTEVMVATSNMEFLKPMATIADTVSTGNVIIIAW